LDKLEPLKYDGPLSNVAFNFSLRHYTMASMVWCGDNDELTTYSSTQCPQKHQKMIAEALNMPCHKVRRCSRCTFTLL